MSCTASAKKGVAGAVTNGVTGAGSTAGYVLGTLGGAVVGAGLGTLLLPGLGSVGGALTGAGVGQQLTVEYYRTSEQQAQETAWRQSDCGQAAIATHERGLAEIRRRSGPALDRLAGLEGRVRHRYQTALNEGTQAMSGKGGRVKAILTAPETKVIGKSTGRVLAAVGKDIAVDKLVGHQARRAGTSHTPIGGKEVGLKAGLSAYDEVGKVGRAIAEEREKKWLTTPAGREARARLERDMARIAARRSQVELGIVIERNRVLAAYDQARRDWQQKIRIGE